MREPRTAAEPSFVELTLADLAGQGRRGESRKQQVFSEMVLGALVYAVVLGFFNDYTEVLSTTSYSTTFFVAIVLQILTYFTLQLKSIATKPLKTLGGRRTLVATVLVIWLIMFLSKFVFLAVISVIFGDDVEISGFFGLLFIIACMMVAKIAIDLTYAKLA